MTRRMARFNRVVGAAWDVNEGIRPRRGSLYPSRLPATCDPCECRACLLRVGGLCKACQECGGQPRKRCDTKADKEVGRVLVAKDTSPTDPATAVKWAEEDAELVAGVGSLCERVGKG